MGLIRKAIVIGGILYALPSAPGANAPGSDASWQSSTFAAIEAATGTMADLKGFCERQPQACVAGQYLAYTAENKAKYLIQIAGAWSSTKTPAVTAPAQADAVADTTPAPAKPQKPGKAGVPQLRVATLNDSKPASIEDLLKGSQD